MEYRHFSPEDFASDDLFIKWVKNPDPQVNLFWDSFIKDNPHKAAAIAEAKALIMMMRFPVEELADESIAKMRNRILSATQIEKDSTAEYSKPIFNESNRRFSWMNWAAMISLPLSMLALIYLLSAQSGAEFSKGVSMNAEYRMNPKGQKSVLRLPDGTKVWLNADSRLNFNKDLDKGSLREVYLEGEAYFDVARNPARPFIVHTSLLSIKVLGTAFNVKSYPEDRTIETTLIHGSVSINKVNRDKGTESLILSPNQRAVFIKAQNTMSIEQIVANKAVAWKFDKLIFDETPLDEVIEQLERWYDINIHVEDAGDLSCKLTAEIENEKLEDVLKFLSIAYHVSWSISEKDVYIQGDLCQN